MSTVLTLDEAPVRAVLKRQFSVPRPYTVASSGALALLIAVLRAAGHTREADRLTDAVGPLVRATQCGDVLGLSTTLGSPQRPPRSVSEALRGDELNTALAAAFRALDWPEFQPTLATWSPSGEGATTDITLTGPELTGRRELLVALSARVVAFEAAFEADGRAWEFSPLPVDNRSLTAASRLLGIPLTGRPVTGEVNVAERYGNRVGRVMAAAAMSRLGAALKATAPATHTRRALCVLGAVAEAVGNNLGRFAPPAADVEVPVRGWTPASWWPVLDSWGSPSQAVRESTVTAWRLGPAEFDVAVWSLMWSLAWVATCAAAPARPLTAASWGEHVRETLDPKWSRGCESAWSVMQATRRVQDRAPFPTPFASDRELSSVDFVNVGRLPWG